MTPVLASYTIGKQFRFEAAHQLHGLPAGHKCARMHGHSYIVEVAVSGSELDGTGFVTDFANLKPFRTYIDDTLDHQVLNDVLSVQPSAENLAVHLAEWFIENISTRLEVNLQSLRVWETATSFAELRFA